jgi:hypothetical protein
MQTFDDRRVDTFIDEVSVTKTNVAAASTRAV